MQLDGKVVLITGAASGLGEATARRFVTAGARVALLDLQIERGQALAVALGEQALFVEADVVSEDAVAAAIAQVMKRCGALHVVINCAGVGRPQRTLSREGPASYALFRKVVEINLFGTFNVLRLAAAEMAKNTPEGPGGERGVVINTASLAAYDGQVGQASYSASKGAVVAMTLPVARDLASVGIRVMTIAPGIFETPILEGLSPQARESLSAVAVFPRRLGEPDEYAQLAQCIVENAYLNGETIRLDAATRLPPK